MLLICLSAVLTAVPVVSLPLVVTEKDNLPMDQLAGQALPEPEAAPYWKVLPGGDAHEASEFLVHSRDVRLGSQRFAELALVHPLESGSIERYLVSLDPQGRPLAAMLFHLDYMDSDCTSRLEADGRVRIDCEYREATGMYDLGVDRRRYEGTIAGTFALHGLPHAREFFLDPTTKEKLTISHDGDRWWVDYRGKEGSTCCGYQQLELVGDPSKPRFGVRFNHEKRVYTLQRSADGKTLTSTTPGQKPQVFTAAPDEFHNGLVDGRDPFLHAARP